MDFPIPSCSGLVSLFLLMSTVTCRPCLSACILREKGLSLGDDYTKNKGGVEQMMKGMIGDKQEVKLGPVARCHAPSCLAELLPETVHGVK